MSLLERFRKGSDYTSEGRFSLDESRAQKKMAQYQLARREDYLFLMIQAAVASRASSLAVEINDEPDEGAQGVVFRASKTNLKEENLKQLDDFLFAGELEQLPYYLIGFALNSVESFCVRPAELTLNEDKDLILTAHFREPFSDLESVLTEKLKYCLTPVTLLGEKLAVTKRVENISLELSEGEFSSIELVRYGVLIETKTFNFEPRFTAKVEDSNFTLDASFSHVVENSTYTAHLHSLQDKAWDRVESLAQEYEGDVGSRLRLVNYMTLDAPGPVRVTLENCRLFPLADRKEWATYHEIQRQAKKTKSVFYSSQPYRMEMDYLVVLCDSLADQESLSGVFRGRKLVNADSDYLQALEIQNNERQWRARPRPTSLPDGKYLVRRFVRESDWEAEIGFLGAPSSSKLLDVLFQNCLLSTEALSEKLPPGAQAVVNFEKVEVNPSWTGATGRVYRAAIKKIESNLRSVFSELVEIPEEALYPELRDYLFELLRKNKNAPEVARKVPFFKVFGETKLFSIEDIQSFERLALGDEPARLSKKLPLQLLPQPLLKYGAIEKQILDRQFPQREVEDIRELQTHLNQLHRALAHPIEPRLPKQNFWRIKDSIKMDSVEGEIGIRREQKGGMSVTFLHEGVRVEVCDYKSKHVFGSDLILQSRLLSPCEDWTSVKRDKPWGQLVEGLKAEIASMEQGLITNPSTEPKDVFRLLLAYPKTLVSYEDVSFVPGTQDQSYFSLNELRKELQKNKALLIGEQGDDFGNSVVLAKLSRKQKSFLSQHLGPFKTKSAEKVFEAEKLRADFLARPQSMELQLEGSFLKTIPIKFVQGELGIGPQDEISFLHFSHQEGPKNFLDLYHQGRRVCRKQGVLPSYLCAVVEVGDFKLNSEYNDVDIPRDFFKKIECLGEELLLSLLTDGEPSHRDFAVETLAYTRIDPELQTKLRALDVFPLLGGGFCNVNDAMVGSKVVRYVTHQTCCKSSGEELVLQLSKIERKLFKKIGKSSQLRSAEKSLLARQEALAYLQTLPKQVPPSLYSQTFRSASLEAHIALAKKTTVYGLDAGGRALGLVRWNGLSVFAIVRGVTAQKVSSDERPAARLSKAQRQEFSDWVDLLHLQWKDDFLHGSLTPSQRNQALFLLSQTSRALESDEMNSQAKLAQALWEYPLFERADGTYTSGQSLQKLVEGSKKALLVSDKSWRRPEHCLILERESQAFHTLMALFKKSGIEWFSHPPLLDTAKALDVALNALFLATKPLEALVSFLHPKPKVFQEKKKAKRETKALETDNSVDPEEEFMNSMKSELSNLLGRKRRDFAKDIFKATEIGSWALGPPVYEVPFVRTLRFNRQHSCVRWLLAGHGSQKSRRVMRLLLLVHWIALVNLKSEEFTDIHEKSFLVDLSEKLVASFG